MPNRIIWGAVAVALAPFIASQDGLAQGRAAHASRAGAHVRHAAAGPTRVYLLRGLWNVWSYGMDDLANKLRAVGVEAVVVNHTAWPQIADGLIRARASGEYTGPIVLVGHSLGGDDIVRLAQTLGGSGIAVDLLMPVDAVTPLQVPGNVRRVINFYQANNGWGKALQPASGFHGAFTNADLESNRRDLREVNTTHTSIDKGPKVHAEIIREVLRLRAGHGAPRARHHARPGHGKGAPPQARAAAPPAAAPAAAAAPSAAGVSAAAAAE